MFQCSDLRASVLVGLGLIAAPAAGSVEPVMLASFDAASSETSRNWDEHSGNWWTVNDTVMGGRSSGGGLIRDGVMLFAGTLNTNGGGFTSVRSDRRPRGKPWDLSSFDGLRARVRGDGRAYTLRIYTGTRTRWGGEVSYRGSFTTERLIDAEGRDAGGDGAWQDVFVPFSAFVPMWRGQDLTGRVEALDPAEVSGLGLMLSDGMDGPFRLEMDWLRADEQPETPEDRGDHP